MRLSPPFLLYCVLLAVAVDTAAAAPPAARAATEREAAMQAKITRLEAQLSHARQTISDLEADLQTAREAFVANQAAPTATAGGAIQPAQASDVVSAAGSSTIWDIGTKPVPPGRESPAAVTRLDTKRLALGGVEDLSRLEFLVPGLRYGQTGHDARLSMRGTRTNSIGPEASSAVGVYEDGIFIPTSTMRLDSILDVDRIEVLRGPQVTNFGQHAYAGAVSIVTNKPNFEGFEGVAEGENSLPDRTRWRLSLNVPVTDTLALRVAGLSESRSGWIDNRVLEPDSDDLNDRKEQTLRSSVLWQPSDRFSILFWRRFQDENGTGTAPWGYQQIGAYLDGEFVPGHQFAAQGFTPDAGPWDVNRNFISAAQQEHELNTVDLNWDAGVAKLQWLTNYMRFESSQTYDSDFSDQGDTANSAFAGWSTDESGWSSELRLSSSGATALDWLVGLYWSERDADWGWLQAINGDFSQPAWDVNGEFSAETKAAFGQVSTKLGKRFTLSGGLRWNEDTKTLKTGATDSWDDVLWKIALQFDINQQMMSYISVSSGYLAGGINSAPGVNPSWEPETLTAYEAGLKSTLLDDALRLNLAVWYNDFDDVQSQSFLLATQPGPEAIEFTGNGGAMEAKGVEAEIQWSPLPGWDLATNVAYTDAQFGDYVASNLNGLGDIPGHTQGDLLSFKDWRPALSPKWVVGLQTSYTFSFERWGTLTPYLQSTYASNYFVSDINLPGVNQDSHNRTDFRLIWQPTDSFQIQFYALNHDDTATLNWARVYNPAARPDITTLQANWNNPSTQGILFNYRF